MTHKPAASSAPVRRAARRAARPALYDGPSAVRQQDEPHPALDDRREDGLLGDGRAVRLADHANREGVFSVYFESRSTCRRSTTRPCRTRCSSAAARRSTTPRLRGPRLLRRLARLRQRTGRGEDRGAVRPGPEQRRRLLVTAGPERGSGARAGLGRRVPPAPMCTGPGYGGNPGSVRRPMTSRLTQYCVARPENVTPGRKISRGSRTAGATEDCRVLGVGVAENTPGPDGRKLAQRADSGDCPEGRPQGRPEGRPQRLLRGPTAAARRPSSATGRGSRCGPDGSPYRRSLCGRRRHRRCPRHRSRCPNQSPKPPPAPWPEPESEP